MGSLLSVVGTDLVCNGVNWHYASRAERISKLAFDLDYQGLRLDVLNTIREEIRDQVSVIISSLDNLMVVATLMLTIGFGFVVEGTFPPKKTEALMDWDFYFFQIDPLVIYAILCALSLVCPFWCIILTISLRYEVDTRVAEHMRDLKKQICNVLEMKRFRSEKRQEDEITTFGKLRPQPFSVRSELGQSDSMKWGRDLLDFTTRATGLGNAWSCPKRLREPTRKLENVVDSIAQECGTLSMPKEVLMDTEDVLKWAREELMYKMLFYTPVVKAARFLLWMGLMCALFTCAILLGMYMRAEYPNTPLMWRTYAGIICSSGLVSMLFLLCWSMLPTGTGRRPCKATLSCHPCAEGFACFGKPLLGGDSLRERTCSTMTTGESDIQSRRSVSDVRASVSFADYTPASLAQSSRIAADRAWVKVRELASGRSSYRRVEFDRRRGYTGLEESVCRKFSKGILGAVVSVGPGLRHELRIQLLTRISDTVEIVDDEDVYQLLDGDECEVTFSAPAPAVTTCPCHRQYEDGAHCACAV